MDSSDLLQAYHPFPILEDKMEMGAHFSECRRYRYSIWRIWDNSKPLIMFIGLNPSTANESSNDPTIRRVIGFAKKWGYGGVYMMNCFPYISTDPTRLDDWGQKEENETELQKIAEKCNEIIFAWGNFKIVTATERHIDMMAMFPKAKALIVNKNGSPRHPLYIPLKTIPVNFLTTSKG